MKPDPVPATVMFFTAITCIAYGIQCIRNPSEEQRRLLKGMFKDKPIPPADSPKLMVRLFYRRYIRPQYKTEVFLNGVFCLLFGILVLVLWYGYIKG